MQKSEISRENFNQNYNCSQSVLAAFAPELGLDRDLALRMATGMGAGLARQGGTCGAVLGAILAIGLKAGMGEKDSPANKDKTYTMVQEFTRRFTALHGSIQCPGLLGLDLSIPEERQSAQDQGLFKSQCPIFVMDSARLVEELFDEIEN